MSISVRPLFILILLCGCNTLPTKEAKEYREESYVKRLTVTEIFWDSPQKIPTKINLAVGRTYGELTPEDNNGIANLVQMFAQGSRGSLSKALSDSNVQVDVLENTTTAIYISPIEAEVICITNYGCQYSLSILVSLIDKPTKRSVWRSTFKTSADLPRLADRELILNKFSEFVIEQLRISKLI